MAVSFIYIDTEDGVPVDKIEYDPEALSPAVANMMSDHAKTQAEAVELCRQITPGSELSPRERAAELAAQIVAKSVPDRDADTYGPEGATLIVRTSARPSGLDAGAQVTKIPATEKA